MTPQELKNSILQLAIQGKLVEQRPEEGTAEEIYHKIQKHHKGLKPCKDELDFSAMNFEIPETWMMVELNQLYNFIDYRGKTPIKSEKGVFLITASNIRQGYMDYTRKEYISTEEYDRRKSRGITQRGDLLFTTEAPMGNASICDLEKCSCGQRIITFQQYEKNTAITELYMYFILSPQFQKQLLNNCTGTTAKGIKADKLKHLLIPLPPLAEQKRIVAKIEELLPYIDRYEQAWSKLEQFNNRFPEDMKKSLLQYAIQGKLVEQRPEEGTAEELFAQIQKEKQKLIAEKKIKKEKPLPEITDDEKPFDIPDSWKWVRLGDIGFTHIGLTYSPRDVSETGTIVLRSSNIQNSCVDYKDIVRVNTDIPENKICHIGDILICARNGSKRLVGKAAIIDREGMSFGAFMAIFRSKCNAYVLHVINSIYFRNSLLGDTGTTTINQITQVMLKNVLIPLPPLAEQKRIVEKLEQLLPLCDKLIRTII